MTPPGLAQLQTDEGYRPQLVYAAFQDTRGVWTIAGGITGPGIGPGVEWTPKAAEAAWAAKVASTEAGLRDSLPEFAPLQTAQPVRADVLVNIAFNVGVHGLTQWPITLSAVWACAWDAAADDIDGNALWTSEVHGRATRCAAAMRAGSWTPQP